MVFRQTHSEITERDTIVLQFSGDLDFDDRTAFRTTLDAVLDTERNQIVLDMGEVRRMSSVYIGSIISVAGKATETGKTFSVVAPKRIAKLLRESGADKIMTLIEARA